MEINVTSADFDVERTRLDVCVFEDVGVLLNRIKPLIVWSPALLLMVVYRLKNIRSIIILVEGSYDTGFLGSLIHLGCVAF